MHFTYERPEMLPSSCFLQLLCLFIREILDFVDTDVLLDPRSLRRGRHHKHALLENPLHYDLIRCHLRPTSSSDLNGYFRDATSHFVLGNCGHRIIRGWKNGEQSAVRRRDNVAFLHEIEQRFELLGYEQMIFNLPLFSMGRSKYRKGTYLVDCGCLETIR